MKVSCSFVNGRYSNSLDAILFGWLPISERIDICTIKLAHKALYVAPFPSYLKLSFKKPSRYLRNKDEFLINNYDKNSSTFTGKARTLFNPTRFHWLSWFNALCNSKLARYIYYRCSFDSFSILQPHRLSKFAWTVLYPYAVPVCHLLI